MSLILFYLQCPRLGILCSSVNTIPFGRGYRTNTRGSMRPHCVVAQTWIQPEQRRSARRVNPDSPPSFIKQELALFSNDQRFVYYEDVVAGVMQLDDSRVLHPGAETLDCRRLRDSGDRGHSHAGATTGISPTRTNWPKPIDSIARRFVTIRVIGVSNPSHPRSPSSFTELRRDKRLRHGKQHYFFEFLGGSSRMNDQETSAVWPLS